VGPKQRVHNDPKGKPNCLKTGGEWKWLWLYRDDAGPGKTIKPGICLNEEEGQLQQSASICSKRIKGYLRENTRAARASFHGMMRQQCCRCDHVQLFQANATSIVPLKWNEESVERVVLDSKTKRCEDKAWSASFVTLKKSSVRRKALSERESDSELG
jgi:hypothetical protein